jgi:hypothetical protein
MGGLRSRFRLLERRFLKPAGAALERLRPLSYIKALGNEYSGGQGLGAASPAVGGTVHGVAYEDITDGSFQLWFPHYGASAGYGECSTGGTATIDASIKWIDATGVQRITVLQTKAGANVASASAFPNATSDKKARTVQTSTSRPRSLVRRRSMLVRCLRLVLSI